MKWTIAVLAVLAVSLLAVQAVKIGRADITALIAAEDTLTNSYVEFEEIDATTVEVHVHIEGIKTNATGEHGIHIHTYGDLSAPSALGPHWDPEGHDHGCHGGDRYAYGDLGNWTAVAGTINQTRRFSLLALSGPFSIIGRGVVLHGGADDCQRVASAQGRIAAGVIGIKNLDATTNEALAPNITTPLRATCWLKATTSVNVTEGIPTGAFYWTQQTNNGAVYAAGTASLNRTVGIHVHTFGDLSGADGMRTGAHWDPAGTGAHALPSATTPHHAGDMGNVESTNIGNDGKVWYEHTFPVGYMTIYQNAGASILGRGFIVHQTFDDGQGTAGNAGVRIAQCVVGIASPTDTRVTNFPGFRTPSNPTTPRGNASTLSFSALLALLAVVIALFQ